MPTTHNRNQQSGSAREEHSLCFLISGNGKGKTTAAFGHALRVWGNGGRVVIMQFIKSPQWETGEVRAVRAIASPRLRVLVGGRGFVGILGDRLPRAVHEHAARRMLAAAASRARSGRWDLVVLDEVLVALSLNLLSVEEVVDVVRHRHQRTDLMLTGRATPAIWRSLLPLADIATKCMEVRHPFQCGVQGRRGREY